eukprot:TRINITY_DN371_c0_g2_i1.p1 TRINITY_DN371_c0_g2~~TRINITY_DN371_c0_g2_i1.p1  ORF type:complete len:1083 (-),score=104.08 TRINITY_DN371_c0_g2_i1:329-3577(-)
MSVRTIHRGQLAAISASKTPLYLRSTVDRVNRTHALQVRMLWWYRRPRDWHTNIDEYLNEGYRRHEKIMKYKYSKALRRRALWDREDTPRWSWRAARCIIGRYQMNHPLSTSMRHQESPRSDKEQTSAGKADNDWEEPKDFESFRSFIDRQVARDPYSALFGRKLQSPPSTNNSSWTSFSWILTPGRTKEENPEPGRHESQSSMFSDPNSDTSTAPSSQPSVSTKTPAPEATVADEYEYDPITMRKVIKTKPALDTAPPKPFLESLFSEHGVDIPVKTYKPHKVYGYGSNEEKAESANIESERSSSKGFGSSRKSELAYLMSQVKGSSIDTTAVYTEPLDPSQPSEKSDDAAPYKSRESPEPDDSSPLFSGTTYESRALAHTDNAPASDWLVSEGFRPSKPDSSTIKSTDAATAEVSTKKSQSILTPALDRIQSTSTKAVNYTITKLETSLDRHVATSKRFTPSEAQPPSAAALETKTNREVQQDIDLLRASDVRASTRSARVTKQEIEQQKQSVRSKLESDFAKQQTLAQTEGISTPPSNTRKVTRGLNNIWNHIREYPGGIVAKTMKSMTNFNDNYKKYERASHNPDLTNPLVFDDKALENSPSIYKPTKTPIVTPSSPSQEYVKAQLERSNLTESLRTAAQQAEEQVNTTNVQISKLAADIKAIYEEEYGLINTRHRQPVSDTTNSTELQDTSVTKTQIVDSQKQHPLSTASVKPGVVTNPIIDRHISEFEPKYAKIVDEMKKSKAALQELQAEVKSSASDNVEKQQPTEVPEPVFTPSNSPVWNDEQPPPIESLRKPSFTSPFVVLAYNRKTGNVDATEMSHRPLTDEVSIVDPIKALGKLHRPADFLSYFGTLDKAGYELYHSGRKILVFKKKQSSTISTTVASEATSQSAASKETPSEISPPVESSLTKEAAKVLDEIPSEIIPVPGPAAPTAPPTSRYNEQRSSPQIRRQEDVFSGTLRSPRDNFVKPQPLPSTSEGQPESETESQQARSTSSGTASRGFGARVKRALRTLLIWTATLSVGAYTVGVIAEGVGAQSQAKKGIDDANAHGPRKKIVLPIQQAERQRPGIYSTESSR